MTSPERIVEAEFIGPIRSVLGISECRLKLPAGSTLIDVLLELERKYFIPKGEHITEREDGGRVPAAGYIILLNGRDYRVYGEADSVAIEDGDRITVISSLHGG